MKFNTLFNVFIVCFLFLTVGCSSQKTINEFVQIEGGIVSGEYLSNSEITVFKGVPFAAPPVGDLRWKAPRPVEKWNGILGCKIFSASPMQRTPEPFMMWTQEFIAPKEPLSEDCLYLNIWTPAKLAGENHPVFVYIYGGGFNSGSGSVPVYDGEEMAKKGLVFLIINYRVGNLGFLAHHELTAESENNTSGNYGLLDQVEALKWVNKNIKAFGGDPENVTIAGQSAGAFSVNYLVASPLTKGLIHRAIAESGGAIMQNGRKTLTLEQAEETGVNWAKSQNASIKELREKPATEIFNTGGPSSPIIDGYLVPDQLNNIFTEGKQNDIPLILGWNKDEGFGGASKTKENFISQIKLQFNEKSEEFLTILSLSIEDEVKSAQLTLSAIQSFGLQMYKWMLLQNSSGNSKVFMYRFDKRLPFAEGMNDHGAFHTGEVPYAYNNLKMSPRPWEDVDYELADSMSDFWVNFAKTSDPNGEGLPVWDACTPFKSKAIIFNSLIESKDMPDTDILNFLDSYYSSLIQ
ncbi:MAG: carboxylesterase family protein [Mariniphaga sp.]|nr:carboxylesterase family protein [Mariniphaga sp.]